MLDSIKAALALGCLLTSTATVCAAPTCDNASLSGQYAFKATGTIVGVFDPSGTLQLLAAPQLLTGVGEFAFDGNGSFTRIDYAVGNGTPSISASTPLTAGGFRAGQTGTYSVSDDCTGMITLSIPGGTEIVFPVALVKHGRQAYGVLASEQVPGFPPALLPGGTTCGSGCQIGVNLLIEMTRNAVRRG